jgi:hypothetical protein
MRGSLVAAVMLVLAGSPAAHAQPARTSGAIAPTSGVDRVVVRWYTLGAAQRPRFVTARELAFEARVEALSEEPGAKGYSDKHVRAALQRRITETILAELPVEPAPSKKQVAAYAEAARVILEQQVSGRANLKAAATAEGISAGEINALLRRRARASWYLDRMVAPMLRPSELDLREVHKRGETPFSQQRYEDVEEPLRRWYIATRLREAIDEYYRGVRSRVRVWLIRERGTFWGRRR